MMKVLFINLNNNVTVYDESVIIHSNNTGVTDYDESVIFLVMKVLLSIQTLTLTIMMKVFYIILSIKTTLMLTIMMKVLSGSSLAST